jgi:hypothetical protein
MGSISWDLEAEGVSLARIDSVSLRTATTTASVDQTTTIAELQAITWAFISNQANYRALPCSGMVYSD